MVSICVKMLSLKGENAVHCLMIGRYVVLKVRVGSFAMLCLLFSYHEGHGMYNRVECSLKQR